ncbi:MAG: hypothetical protein N2483_03935 [Burkholderiaceae bacterium]|nr:hypothetical protein [Burkholderiaceae bacterium]
MTPPLSDEKARRALDAVRACGDYSAAARMLGVPLPTFRNWIAHARARWPDEFPAARPEHKAGWMFSEESAYTAEIFLTIASGKIIVFGDAHYGWSEKAPPAHGALLRAIERFRPTAIIANGDVIDGASVCRHPPLGQQRKPRMDEEVLRAVVRLDEISAATPPECRKIRTVGNHDQRYDRHLATYAPDFAALHGARLRDHFPGWEEAWRVCINGEVMVLHHIRGGVHAAWNNALHSGISTVTNHTHALEVRPFSDYRGRRYAVQAGMIADRKSAAFEYLSGRPVQWGEGFAVLSFDAGRMQSPALCERIGDRFYLFGEVLHELEDHSAAGAEAGKRARAMAADARKNKR